MPGSDCAVSCDLIRTRGCERFMKHAQAQYDGGTEVGAVRTRKDFKPAMPHDLRQLCPSKTVVVPIQRMS